MVARYNSDLANNLGNLLSRVATLVGSKCGGIGPAAPADSPLAAVAERVYTAAAAAWDRFAPSEALGGHLAADPGGQRPPGGQRAVEVRARARRSTPCSATGIEALRIVAVLASPAIPAASGRGVAPAGPARLAGGAAAARGGGVGRLPGRAARREGQAALPPPQVGGAPLMWADSHCHLQYEGITADALDRAAAAGVGRIICVGTDAPQSAKAIDVARAHPGTVWATVGLHPHDAIQGVDGDRRPARRARGGGVGECGLDYHYDHSPREVQREAFAAQIGLAHEHGLALVIHTREAWDDTFAILRAEGVPERTVFHCFTGGPTEARRCLDLGASLSFSGIVTFKTAGDVREAAALAPLDRILVETDAPYLTPVPHRGRRTGRRTSPSSGRRWPPPGAQPSRSGGRHVGQHRRPVRPPARG